MELECFPTATRPPDIVPGRPQRAWMDAFSDRHPYRCLPMTMANTTGWEILCPVAFTAEWNGGIEQSDIKLAPEHPFAGFEDFVKSHFAHGVVTFHPATCSAPPRAGRLGRRPAQPRQGRHPAAGGPGGDRLAAFPFTMNWVFTRPGRVRFAKGEPFCFINPGAGQGPEAFELVQRPLERDLDLLDQYEAWPRPPRRLQRPALQARAGGREGGLAALLFQGRDALGDRRAAQAHVNKRRLKTLRLGL